MVFEITQSRLGICYYSLSIGHTQSTRRASTASHIGLGYHTKISHLFTDIRQDTLVRKCLIVCLSRATCDQQLPILEAILAHCIAWVILYSRYDRCASGASPCAFAFSCVACRSSTLFYRLRMYAGEVSDVSHVSVLSCVLIRYIYLTLDNLMCQITGSRIELDAAEGSMI